MEFEVLSAMLFHSLFEKMKPVGDTFGNVCDSFFCIRLFLVLVHSEGSVQRGSLLSWEVM